MLQEGYTLRRCDRGVARCYLFGGGEYGEGVSGGGQASKLEAGAELFGGGGLGFLPEAEFAAPDEGAGSGEEGEEEDDG